jgi:hypothetical protein
MTPMNSARARLQEARGLAAVLDAAYESFEGMLAAIREGEDPGDGMFIPLVMAAAPVADGRDAIADAPSLPPRRLDAAKQPCSAAGGGQVAGEVAALAGLLADRLDGAAGSAANPRDRAACREAARCAREVRALLAGSEP